MTLDLCGFWRSGWEGPTTYFQHAKPFHWAVGAEFVESPFVVGGEHTGTGYDEDVASEGEAESEVWFLDSFLEEVWILDEEDPGDGDEAAPHGLASKVECAHEVCPVASLLPDDTCQRKRQVDDDQRVQDVETHEATEELVVPGEQVDRVFSDAQRLDEPENFWPEHSAEQEAQREVQRDHHPWHETGVQRERQTLVRRHCFKDSDRASVRINDEQRQLFHDFSPEMLNSIPDTCEPN